MNPRSLILIAVAGVGVLLVVLLTRSFLSGLEQQSQQVQTTAQQLPAARILVASKPLSVGTILTKDHVSWRPWPEDGVADDYFSQPKNKIEDLVGKVVRTPVSGGEPVTKTAVVSQGEKGFMAAVLSPGMRAVTVKLSPTSSVGGFVFPGDRVDVILTQSFEMKGTKIPYVTSETVFQNVRVLGVDQRSPADTDEVKVAKTATLEVTPKMAEKVAMLERLGSLSLSLRSLAGGNDGLPSDPDSPPVGTTLTFTGSPEVSQFRPDATKDEKRDTVIVRRGSDAKEVDGAGESKEPGK
ncbi:MULTISPECIES: Flp pilus assembly protein CpaB [Kordiimonas]|jgi:pilus assembly protein CpaB|uniref:Flp pilus assembly protein CpaB n=1 Tax=Kordiimonas TaxID=288021 RepID=UPI002580637B|nr:Flp pilus assembly protein CpaB [Kordiimonas sp. UBA4487]